MVFLQLKNVEIDPEQYVKVKNIPKSKQNIWLKTEDKLLLELSASSADDAPLSQCLMGGMRVDSMLLCPEKQNHKMYKC